MNLNDIYELMDKFEKSSMSEIQLELEGTKLVCKKQTEVVATEKIVKNVEVKQENKVEKTAPIIEGTEVKAAVAGTFYRAPSPDSEPFVQVGQKVKAGETIGMIEAMKMMNDIVSPVDGEIVEIIPANEELVGYDDVIFVIQ